MPLKKGVTKKRGRSSGPSEESPEKTVPPSTKKSKKAYDRQPALQLQIGIEKSTKMDVVQALSPVLDTYRKVKVIEWSSTNKEKVRSLFNEDRTKVNTEQGTPHGALLLLLEECKKYLEANRVLSKQDVELYNSIIERTSRGFMRENMDNNTNNISTDINTLVKKTLTVITSKKSKVSVVQKKELLELWSPIMYKALSDISQFGSLLRTINRIPEYLKCTEPAKHYNSKSFFRDLTFKFKFTSTYNGGNPIDTSAFDRILHVCSVLQMPKPLAVSSDIIAAALMTNLSSLHGNSMVPVLCTRKKQGNTAFIIAQNYEIVGFIHYIAHCLDNRNNSNEARAIKSYFIEFCKNNDGVSPPFINSRTIQAEFDEVFRIREQMLEFGENFIDALHNILSVDTSTLSKTKKRNIEELRHTNIYYKIFKLILLIENLTAFLNHNQHHIDNYSRKLWRDMTQNFEFDRYLYTIANMVFSISNPFRVENVAESDVADAEFISAVLDETYGHDYGTAYLNSIEEMGIKVLKSIQPHFDRKPWFITDESVRQHKNKETGCIIELLRKNKMTTITQKNDRFIASFDPNRNYFTDEFFVPAYTEPWNMFLCPLSLSPTFSIIDLTMGIQPYQENKAVMMNAFLTEMYGINDPRQHPTFRITFPQVVSEYVKESIERLNQRKQFIEVFTPASQYDRAASYGAYPVSITGDYESIVEVGDGLWFASKTHSTVRKDIDSTIASEMNIVGGFIKTPLTEVLEELTGIEKAAIEINSEYINRFDTIWRNSRNSKGESNLRTLTGKDYKELLDAFRDSQSYEEFCKKHICSRPKTDTSKTGKDLLILRFNPIMLYILKFILSTSNSNEDKRELLDIFENIMEYIKTQDPRYLGNNKPRRGNRVKGPNQPKATTTSSPISPPIPVVIPPSKFAAATSLNKTQKQQRARSESPTHGQSKIPILNRTKKVRVIQGVDTIILGKILMKKDVPPEKIKNYIKTYIEWTNGKGTYTQEEVKILGQLKKLYENFIAIESMRYIPSPDSPDQVKMEIDALPLPPLQQQPRQIALPPLPPLPPSPPNSSDKMEE